MTRYLRAQQLVPGMKY